MSKTMFKDGADEEKKNALKNLGQGYIRVSVCWVSVCLQSSGHCCVIEWLSGRYITPKGQANQNLDTKSK
jgi:hypothetical protein